MHADPMMAFLANLNKLSQAYLLIDEWGTIHWANPAFYQLASLNESTTNTIAGLDDTTAIDPKAAKNFQEKLQSQAAFVAHVPLKQAEGEVMWLEMDAQPYETVVDTPQTPFLYLAHCRDVTEYQAQMERLHLLEAVMEVAEDVILITESEPLDIQDKGPKVVSVNPAFTRLTGYEADEIIGETPRILQGPATSRAELDRIRHSLENWNSVESELINYKKDGTPFHVSMIISPIHDKKGWFTHWVAIQRDITARKEAEQKLSNTNYLFKETQRIAQMGSWELDVATGDTVWTEEVYRIHEVELDFEHNKTSGIEFYHPDDQSLIREAIHQAIEAQTRFDVSCRLITAKGNQIWVRAIGDPVVENGVVTKVIGLFQDISQQKTTADRLEKESSRLTEILEATRIGTWEWDIEADTVQINDRLAEILGYSQGELTPVTIEKCKSVLHPEDKRASLQELYKHMTGELTHFKKEMRIRHKDGHWIWVLNRGKISPVKFASDPIIMTGTLDDISERKHTEQQLMQVSQRFKLAAQAAGIGVWDYDIVSDTLIWDEQMHRLFGTQANQFKGIFEDWAACLHPDDIQRAKEEFQLALQGEKEFDTEFRVIRPDGKIRHIGGIATLVRDVQQQAIRVIGINIDNTERREATEALRLASLIMENSEVIAMRSEVTAGWPIQFVSDNISQFGYQAAVLIDEHFSYRDLILKEDLPEIRDALKKAIKAGISRLDVQCRLVTPEGRTHWTSNHITIEYDANNHASYLQAVIIDISERKQQLDQLHLLQSVVESTKDAILITSADPQQQNILYANFAHEEMTGYKLEEIIGQSPRIFQGPKTQRSELERIRTAIEQGMPVQAELINYRKDNREFWVDMMITGVRDDNGRISHFVSVQRDVTDRKQAELALIEAKEQAEKASVAKSEFLSTMSHEIRTPLNAVIGMTGLLSETPLNSDQQSFLNTIRQGGENLLSVINDILDYSKIEAGKVELENEQFTLIDPIEDTLDLLAGKAFEKGVELINATATTLPRTVKGDITRLRQILVNLVGNAIKFTKEGEIVVSVRQVESHADWTKLEFSVRDSGIGISREKQTRLFRSFSQGDASTTREYGGTGLGLAISQKLVQLLGGNIWLESEEGVGSTFFFTIVIEVAEGPPPAIESFHELVGKTALIVDDNPSHLSLLQQQFSALGMHVTASASPVETLALLEAKKTPFDIAIIDMLMPEINGLELAKRVRNICTFSAMPLLLLSSGSGIDSDEKKQLFDAILQKPARRKQLYEETKRLITGSGLDKKIEQPAIVTEMDLSNYNILLAEDNMINQKVAKRILDKFHARVEIANNGQEAVEFIKLRKFDLVLMDMQMPIMDGIEATKTIRNLPEIIQPTIWAMTANASETDRQACLAAGMDAFLTKPIKIEVLRESFTKWLSQLPAQISSIAP